jgi:hypothetical protein
MTVTRHHRRRPYRTVSLPLRPPSNVHLQREGDVDVVKVKVKVKEDEDKEEGINDDISISFDIAV